MLKISAGGPARAAAGHRPAPAIFLTSRRLLMRPLGARRRAIFEHAVNNMPVAYCLAHVKKSSKNVPPAAAGNGCGDAGFCALPIPPKGGRDGRLAADDFSYSCVELML